MLEVDVQQDMVLSVSGASVGTGSSTVFGEACRNILINRALGAELT